MHLGFDPMHRKRDQTHTDAGVKTFDRFHQADITLLNQVCLIKTVTRIALGDMHHKTQVRHNQLTRRLKIFLVEKPLRERSLLFDG